MLVVCDGNIMYVSLWIGVICFLKGFSNIILGVFYGGFDGLCLVILCLEWGLFLQDISKMRFMTLCKVKNYERGWYYDILFP